MSKKEIFSFKSKYEDIEDEELVKLINNGDKNALDFLLEKYSDLVRMKATKFFIIGAEKEDMIQEGLIGLYKAIKSYDFDKQNSFKTFANLCIERQLISAIKSSNRQKNMALNSSFSLNLSAYDENDDTSLMDVLDTKIVEDPLDTITKKEHLSAIENKIEETLSGFERKVLNFYIQGESYVDIAEKLDSPVKAVDNAIQRIRRKAIKYVDNNEEQ
jgi:RNA polymerase sporulation-specific sigma factor